MDDFETPEQKHALDELMSVLNKYPQNMCPAVSAYKSYCNGKKGHWGRHWAEFKTPKGRVIKLYWTDTDPVPKPDVNDS